MIKQVHTLLVAAVLSLFSVTALANQTSNKSFLESGIEAFQALYVSSDSAELNYTSDDTSINLLNYVRIEDTDPRTLPPYKRVEQFGPWIYYDNQLCVNTRTRILSRDSDPNKIEYSTPEKCHVQKGLWFLPYSGEWTDEAKNIEIDHMVPLKNAYLAGAHAWSRKKKCAYANYLGNNFHLLSVSMHENRVKSDRGPEEYMPPNTRIHCSYLKMWLYTKIAWNLSFTHQEIQAIHQYLNSAACPTSTVVVSRLEMEKEHRQTNDVPYGCSFRPDTPAH